MDMHTGSSAARQDTQISTMKATVLAGPGVLETREVAIPEPSAGQVRVRIEGSGVCASNLEVWGGQPWFEYPLEAGAPGHEGWGIVDALGEGVTTVAVGDRVAFLSGHAYAEFDIAEADQVVKLPPEFDGKPFPGEAIGCAMNIYRRSDIRPDQTVAIVGAGFLGGLVTQLAARAGARVVAISRRQFALDTAVACGASDAIPLTESHEVIEQVKELTGGKLCERVIEAVGKQSPLDLSAELCAERGRLVIAGYHQDGPRQVNMWLWNWRGLDVVNAHERDPQVYVEGMRLGVEAARSGSIDPWMLITNSYSLGDLGHALNDTRDRPDGFIKAVVTA
jgi:threonine dehydrogenase-like Zn-dependent dehydrogenase